MMLQPKEIKYFSCFAQGNDDATFQDFILINLSSRGSFVYTPDLAVGKEEFAWENPFTLASLTSPVPSIHLDRRIIGTSLAFFLFLSTCNRSGCRMESNLSPT